MRNTWVSGLFIALTLVMGPALIGSPDSWAAAPVDSGISPPARTPGGAGGQLGTSPGGDVSAVSGTVLQMNRQGWSCLGPVSVSSFSPDTLTLFYPKKNLEIALKGKQVRIMDHRLQAVSTSTISSGTWIYVCRKGGEVVIYRLPGGKEGQE